MQTAWRSIRRAWPTSIGAAAILWAGLFAAPASALPPTITSVTVTSYSTDNDHSIALPQTFVSELTVRGTNLFPAAGAPGPLVVLQRAGYPDKYFPILQNISGGDNTDGWVTVSDVDFSAYEPGSFDIVIDRAAPQGGDDVAVKINAIELKPHGPERLVRRAAWGGPINKAQRVGNLLYLGSGCRFVVVDATNEMNPIELGSIDLLAPVLDFQIRNNYAYVCSESQRETGTPNGFCVLDIGTNTPHLIWNSSALRGISVVGSNAAGSALEASRIWLKGDVAYLAGKVGLHIFSLANPAAPAYVRPIRFCGNNCGGTLVSLTPLREGTVEIVGSYLYAFADYGLNQPGYLQVYDLGSGSGVPSLVNQVQATAGFYRSTSDRPIAVAAEPGLLAWATSGAGEDDAGSPHVILWDVSNPAVPFVKSRFPVLRPLSRLALNSGLLLGADEEARFQDVVEVPDNSLGLVVYDLTSNLPNPLLLANVKTHGSVYGVSAVGQRAYVSDHGEGLIIFDISNPANPARLGGYFSPSSTRDIARNGNLLYVSDQWNGFTILDIADLSRPVVVGNYQIDHATRPDLQGNWGIAYANGRVYLSVGDGGAVGGGVFNAGIDVVDVTSPAQPTLIQAYDAPDCDSFRALEIDGPILRAGAAIHPNICGMLPQFFFSEVRNFLIDTNGISFLSSSGEMPRTAPPENSFFYALQTIETVNGFTYCNGGIVDNRNNLQPVIMSPTAFGEFGRGFVRVGNMVYVDDTLGGPPQVPALRVLDVSDPMVVPHPETTFALGPAGSVVCSGYGKIGDDRLIIAAHSNRSFMTVGGAIPHLHLFDTSNPLRPRLIDSENSPVAKEFPGPHFGAHAMIRTHGSLVCVAERRGSDRDSFHRFNNHGVVLFEHIVASPCRADFNNDQSVSLQDLFSFLAAWFGQDLRADINGQGGIGLQDLFDFLTAWFGGC